MGAGRGQVRSRGPQVRSESGVFRLVRDLVGGALPAVPEAVAVAVHLQDMDVVGEPVQQRAGEAFRSEHLGPLVEGQVGGDQDGAPLVALAEDLEEQFRSGGGQGGEFRLVVAPASFVLGLVYCSVRSAVRQGVEQGRASTSDS